VIPVDWHGGTPPGLGGGLLTFWGRFRRNLGFAGTRLGVVWLRVGRLAGVRAGLTLGRKGIEG